GGWMVGKFGGRKGRALPACVDRADQWKSDVWGAGHMGRGYEPVRGSDLAGRFQLPRGVSLARLNDRDALRRQFDHLCAVIDQAGTMEHVDRYTRQAVEMVTSGKVGRALGLSKEGPRPGGAYGRERP